MGNNISKIILGGIAIVVLAVGAFLAYIWIAGGSGEVSEDISDASETIEGASGGVVYRIDPEDSAVTFTLEEDLRGTRTTVVGRTTQVGGDIFINFDTPLASVVGTIRINSRSFATDQEMRNRAIRTNILLSSQDEFEFIDFVPTEISTMPDSIEIGESYTLDIVGDLSIAGETNSVTFASTITVVSAEEITGTANTTVSYGDWGISIPSVPGVANVSETVDLEITFEADAVQEETTED